MTDGQQSGPDRRSAAAALADALRFLSRLPVPNWPAGHDPHGPPTLSRIGGAFPVAGALIGLAGGITLALGLRFGMVPWVAAAFAVAATALITGGLHEDGLADTLDGFGGGATAERRLAIMTDSRIGSFGAIGLVLSLIIRVGTIGALAQAEGPLGATLVLMAVEGASRGVMLMPLALLEPARPGGRAASAGPPGDALVVALGLSALLLAVLAVPVVGVGRVLLGAAAALGAAYQLARLSGRLIGGHTGDVAGATQQVAALLLLALLSGS